MNITIYCVGRIKERFYSDAVDEYRKRLQRYVKLSVVEVADEKTPDRASEKEAERIRIREGERLLAKLKDRSYVIALAIEGKSYDSVGFSDYIGQLATEGKSDIAFIIGGSLGLSKDVLRRADAAVSFSPMTFPHQLMRVILCEQIYRAFRILSGEPYHK